MNGLSIYLTTCRYVMQADVNNSETWSELYRFLPYLRQALSCCVCRNLIKEPMGPTHNVCQHFVCRRCVGGRMKLKPQCSWCKDHGEFKENTQLRITVLCFKQLCQYISDSAIGTALRGNSPNGETNGLVVIIDEVLKFEDSFTMKSPMQLPASFIGLPTNSPNKTDKCGTKKGKLKSTKCEESLPSTTTKVLEDKNTESKKSSPKSEVTTKIEEKGSSDLSTCVNTDDDSTVESEAEIVVDVDDSDKTVFVETDKNLISVQQMNPLSKFILSPEKQKSTTVLSPQSTGSKSAKGDNSHVNKDTPIKKQKTGEQKEVKICKCGRGGTNSRLTCLGQRCPCYIKRLPCIGCKCKGCRNPQNKVENDLKNVKTDNSSNLSLNNSENIFVTV